jgi:pimeloyl-ACP methyl ester carboxylesterase
MSAQVLPKLAVFATVFCLTLTISSCASPPKEKSDLPLGIAEDQTSFTTIDGDVLYGKYCYPTGVKNKIPAILLLPDLGGTDADWKVAGSEQGIFQHLAYQLASAGFLVFRFDQRGFGDSTETKTYNQSNLDQLISDSLRALGALKTHNLADTERIIVISAGLSSFIAPQLARADNSVKLLLLQNPWAESYRSYLVNSLVNYPLTRLAGIADRNNDGTITPKELEQLESAAEDYDFISSNYELLFSDQDETEDEELHFNPQTDSNGDGILDIEKEIRPALEKQLGAFLQEKDDALTKSLLSAPAPAETISGLKCFVLLWTGEEDALSPPSQAKIIQSPLKADNNALVINAGLGHTMSKVSQERDPSGKTLSYNDYPATWDDANIQELIAWLKANNDIMDRK